MSGPPSGIPGSPIASPSQYPVAPPANNYSPQQPGPSRSHQFDGAGIIQRRGGSAEPTACAADPSGRVLAYLQAEPGVNLDAYVGRAMGLYGQRSHRPDLNGDVLTVRGAVPVRLKQQQ
jgi:hypothetical protein